MQMLNFSEFKRRNRSRLFLESIEDEIDLKWGEDFSEPRQKPGVLQFLDFLRRKRDEYAKVAADLPTSGADLLGGILAGIGKNQGPNFLSKPEDFESQISPVSGSVSVKSGSARSRQNEVQIVIDALERNGIVNPLVQKAILSVIGKESGFMPRNEITYSKTSNDRIRKIFGSRFSKYSDDEINRIKSNPNEFWEVVYGNKYGNDSPGDGAKYIGRGFNGLTFKSNYKKYNDLLKKTPIRVDIVNNPDLLNRIDVAAEVNALYFVNGLSSEFSRKKYGNKDPNDFKDFDTALKAATNANAGWGRNIEGSEDLRRAKEYSANFDIDDSQKINLA
jgi:predicted chitinase